MEQRENVIINASDFNVTQHYYFDKTLQHPLISIDDPYVMTGKQGGENNLKTLFPSEPMISDQKKSITDYLTEKDYKGIISITISIYKNGLFYNSIDLGVPEDFMRNLLNLYGLSMEWFLADLENNTLPES